MPLHVLGLQPWQGPVLSLKCCIFAPNPSHQSLKTASLHVSGESCTLTTSQCEVWRGAEKQTGRTDGRGTGYYACDLELVFIFLNVEFGFFLYSNRIRCRLYSILGVGVF